MEPQFANVPKLPLNSGPIVANSIPGYISNFNPGEIIDDSQEIEQISSKGNEATLRQAQESRQETCQMCPQETSCKPTFSPIKPKKKRKPRAKISFDSNGWADARNSHPHDEYELVELRDVSGNVRPGWWTKNGWETALPCKPWAFYGARNWRPWDK